MSLTKARGWGGGGEGGGKARACARLSPYLPTPPHISPYLPQGSRLGQALPVHRRDHRRAPPDDGACRLALFSRRELVHHNHVRRLVLDRLDHDRRLRTGLGRAVDVSWTRSAPQSTPPPARPAGPAQQYARNHPTKGPPRAAEGQPRGSRGQPRGSRGQPRGSRGAAKGSRGRPRAAEGCRGRPSTHLPDGEHARVADRPLDGDGVSAYSRLISADLG